MGKHHKPETPVIIRRGFGGGKDGSWLGFNIKRTKPDGTLDPFGSEIIIHYYEWEEDHGKEPMHSVGLGSFRLSEVDVSGQSWLSRCWRLDRGAAYKYKLFYITSDGSFRSDWTMEDTHEYRDSHHKWPPLWKMLHYDQFIDHCDGILNDV